MAAPRTDFTPLGTQGWDQQELSLPRHDCMLTLRLDGCYAPKLENEGILAAERTVYGAAGDCRIVGVFLRHG